jgi:hypothetical protein
MRRNNKNRNRRFDALQKSGGKRMKYEMITEGRRVNEASTDYEAWVEMFMEILGGGYFDWEFAANLHKKMKDMGVMEEDDLSYEIEHFEPSPNNVIDILFNRLRWHIADELWDKYAISLDEIGATKEDIVDNIMADVNSVASSMWLDDHFVRELEDAIGRDYRSVAVTFGKILDTFL